MIPHGNVKVFNKNGTLLRTVDVQERHNKMVVNKTQWDGTSFRCSSCSHTLNIEMVCCRCHGKGDVIEARRTRQDCEVTEI